MTKFAMKFLLVIPALILAVIPSAQAFQTETGGDGFRIVKTVEPAGASLRIEYYGWLAERCNAGQGSGHMNHLNFFLRFNGRPVHLQESDCATYRDGTISRRFAILEVHSNFGTSSGGYVNPPLFEGIDHNRPWNLELYVQAIGGDYDSRYGRNYQFQL